jgi:hypothetical protein
MSEDKLRTRIDEYIANIQAAIDDPDLPAVTRAESRKVLNWLQDYRGADPEWRRELERSKKYMAPALRTPVMRRLRETGAVLIGADGAVTVRWDLVATEDRQAAYSALNMLVDWIGNRSVGGRPKK